jgi:catechol-2,3-dioxygenase
MRFEWLAGRFSALAAATLLNYGQVSLQVLVDTLVRWIRPRASASVGLHGHSVQKTAKSEQESSMSSVQIEQKSYEMPPREGMSIAHFLTVADIERSARYYEKVFGARILSLGDGDALLHPRP